MHKVYKYQINAVGSLSVLSVDLPKNAQILSCGFQGHDTFLWALVNTLEENTEPRKIRMFSTGEAVNANTQFLKYINTSTAFMGFVGHFFEDIAQSTEHEGYDKQ